MASNEKTSDNRDENKSEEKPTNVNAGGHLGGTHFGQVPGDAKTKDSQNDADKSPPKDGDK
ncbi:hypothetical protein [Devosia sp. CAU 1758]